MTSPRHENGAGAPVARVAEGVIPSVTPGDRPASDSPAASDAVTGRVVADAVGDARHEAARDATREAAGAPAGFVVELPAFAGPLDLLLSLIRDEQVDVYDIPISRVAQQFLARIKDLGLDEAADYLEMAARLLRIKAQMLLPRNEQDEGWEDPRAELVRRLLEYQQMREVVDVLERLGEDRRNRFARAFVQSQLAPAAPAAAPLALSLGELLGAVDRVLRTVRPPTLHEVVPRALDVAGALVTVRTLIATRARLRWRDVVKPGAEPWVVLSALLALLEMAKLGEVKLAQPRPYADVEITRDAVSEAA